MGAIALRGYYAILDVQEDSHAFQADAGLGPRLCARAEELLAASPCCLQLRAKRLGGGPLVGLARSLAALARRSAIPFCLNDRLDVALAAGADLVHVGQEDLAIGDVRRVLAGVHRQLLVGVSTHSLSQALAAAAAGADYIGFGPVFRTGTKARPDPVVGLEGLREVTAAVPVPVVAIGGITRAAVGAVVAAGAAAAAVIADIETAGNRLEAAREVAGAFGREHA